MEHRNPTGGNEEKEEDVGFEELGLDPRLTRAMSKKGIDKATPIQREAIPLILVCHLSVFAVFGEKSWENELDYGLQNWGCSPYSIGREGCSCASEDGVWQDICISSSRATEALLRGRFRKDCAKCFYSRANTGIMSAGSCLNHSSLCFFIHY